ncbi:MAG: galactitol-1-phosphate 5-dehydrogenase [Planctomycetes bacterium]|nr:galactitol-1-phosphate 5-dehydrogenase [Planctomycetota bacterium]
MKALVLKEYNHFSYEDVPDPEIGPNDVLIRVKACGICGSDVHGMDGSTGRRQPPIVMGHEAAGVIAEVGENVTDSAKGDRVTFDSTIYCGECAFCRKGLINLCDNRRVLGVSCDEYRCHGAFAEYVAVPQHILYRLPDSVTFEQAAMVEPVAIAVHAVERVPISLNDTAVVVGAGMIGLLVVQALQAKGCGRIIAVDIEDDKLAMARELGADEGVKPDDCPEDADVAFEVVGITPAVQTAVGCLRKGGALGLVGNLSPEVELPLQAVVTRQLTLYGSCASCGEYPACLDMIARGAIRVEPLKSATAPLAEGAERFERLYKREKGLMKVVLVP